MATKRKSEVSNEDIFEDLSNFFNECANVSRSIGKAAEALDKLDQKLQERDSDG